MLPLMDTTKHDAVVIQLQLPFNRIYLQENLSLAPNPRKLKDKWLCDNKAEKMLMNSLLVQFKKWGSFERFRKDQYQKVFSNLLAYLLAAHNQSAQLIYSRDTTGRNRKIIKAVDFLTDLNLITSVIPKANELGVESWITPNIELINLLNHYKTRIVFDPNKPSIEIRDKDKRVLPIPERKQARLTYERLEKQTRAFNELWLNHSVTLDNKLMIPFCQRKFNDSLELGGRFYGDFQRLPGKERLKLKIDSIPVVELDYKSQHLAILYSLEGLQIEYDPDPYIIEGFERETVKAITLKLINVKNIADMKRAITLSANPENKAKYQAYKQRRLIHDLRRAHGLTSSPPFKAQWIDSFIENIPEGTCPERFLESFSERHRAIYHHIGSENIGLKLQALDSRIMALVLSACVAENIPALPVHDSLIVRETDKAKTRLIMQTAYKEITGKHCKIDQKKD